MNVYTNYESRARKDFFCWDETWKISSRSSYLHSQFIIIAKNGVGDVQLQLQQHQLTFSRIPGTNSDKHFLAQQAHFLLFSPLPSLPHLLLLPPFRCCSTFCCCSIFEVVQPFPDETEMAATAVVPWQCCHLLGQMDDGRSVVVVVEDGHQDRAGESKEMFQFCKNILVKFHGGTMSAKKATPPPHVMTKKAEKKTIRVYIKCFFFRTIDKIFLAGPVLEKFFF